eukprot:133216-Rhodomonas_salina.3
MAVLGGLERVFEVGPVFRAEQSHTSRSALRQLARCMCTTSTSCRDREVLVCVTGCEVPQALVRVRGPRL